MTTIKNAEPTAKHPHGHRHAHGPAKHHAHAHASSHKPRMHRDAVALSSKQQGAGGLSERDSEALSRAVAAEARGERPEVWTAVAQAIMNYAKETGKPIQRVVRSSFLSSNFDHNRRFYTMATKRIPRFADIRKAVAEAARGESPIGKRSHFIDTSIRIPSWANPHSAVRIGKMIFLNEK
jgi:spore germination cell wall hydrolase CwlJ-like protein